MEAEVLPQDDEEPMQTTVQLLEIMQGRLIQQDASAPRIVARRAGLSPLREKTAQILVQMQETIRGQFIQQEEMISQIIIMDDKETMWILEQL